MTALAPARRVSATAAVFGDNAGQPAPRRASHSATLRGAQCSQHDSLYANAYEARLGRDETSYWEHRFDDSIASIGKIPTIAARIYRNAYRGGGKLPAEVDQ